MKYPKERKLDGIFYRVERNRQYKNVCFTDLTGKEREKVTENYTAEQWKRIAMHLCQIIQQIGDDFDLISGD